MSDREETAWDRAIRFTMRWEGERDPDNPRDGYANHPRDPGGATKWGVTQRTFDTWRRSLDQPTEPVLNLQVPERNCIYLTQYWIKGNCPDLSEDLAVCHFDACVHHGIGRAARFLQVALGFSGGSVDGIIGPKTLAALSQSDEAHTLVAYVAKRQAFMNYLASSRPDKYEWALAGWLNRVADLRRTLNLEERR